MKNKFFTTIFYSSIILLTACGDGSDGSSNGTSTQSKEKIDYTKAESIESIYEPIIRLLAKIKKRSTFCLFFIQIKKSCSTIMST